MPSYKVNVERLEALDKEILRLEKVLSKLDKLKLDRDILLHQMDLDNDKKQP
jgi:hypothetical protein